MDDQQLQERVQEFIRRFGLLDQERTPCGRPMPTSHAHALQILGRGGGMTQRELAARLRLDESTVSRLVDRQVRSGWVERATDERNRRRSRLALTPAGHAVLDEVRRASAAKFRLIQDRIPPAQRGHILAAFDVLIAAIGEEPRAHAHPTDADPHQA